MRLAVHLNENNVKQVKNFLTCCAKLGTVLLIEASTNKMCWRIINSAKSACLMITLQSQFFEHYLLYEVSLMTASVLLKHLLAAFRTPKIKNLELEIVDHDVLTIVVHSESGLMKRYQVACVEEEHLAASIDRNQLPTTITADAFQLQKLLSSFQNTLDEVSLIVRPQSAQTQGNQHIRMASYNGSGKARKGKTLNTIINVDVKGGQLFKSSVLRSNDTMEATFNIKDFTVIVSLCKALHADVMLSMGTPGTPLLVEAANMGFANSMDAVEAELLLATVAEYVQDDLPEAAAATPSRMGGLGRCNTTPMTAGGVATPGTILPPSTINRNTAPAGNSPIEYLQHNQPESAHPQPTQPHNGHMFQTQPLPATSQQQLPPSTTAQTPSNVQVQHPQVAQSGRMLDTHAPQGLQQNNAFSAIPETALGTTAPDLRGVRARAVLATPPNFNMAGAKGTVQADATTPAPLLDPPALTYQPQNSPAAGMNPSQATQPQQQPPSGEAMAPSLRVPSQLPKGAGSTQDGAYMHDNNAASAQAEPLTLHLPALPRQDTTGAVPAHCADAAQGGFGISSWSDLRGDSPGTGMASISDVGRQVPGRPEDCAALQQSQQVAAGATHTGTQQKLAADTASIPHYSDDPGGNPGQDQQEWDADEGGEEELPPATFGADENQGVLHNTATAQYTQHGSVSRSLVRLAEIIKQDERARQAGGSAQQWGSAANQFETVNMHVAGDHLDDEEQALEDADGEFAADDWECLATPPEERPDTFFD